MTGAAGFIGSHTVDRLLNMNCTVLGVDDLSTGRSENLSDCEGRENFEFVRADITEGNSFGLICEKFAPDTIVHLAGLVSVVRGQEEPELNFRLNVQATHLVAEAARKHGVPRVVFSSSAAVYGNNTEIPLHENCRAAPISLYGSAKWISEEILRGYSMSYGLETACLRFFNVFGPRQDPSSPYSGVITIFSDRLASGESVTVFGTGEQTRDFIAVGDVARALCLAATKHELDQVVCNICSGQSTRVIDVFNEVRKHYPDSVDPDFAPMRGDDILHSMGDPTLAAQALGFESEISLAEGLRPLITGAS